MCGLMCGCTTPVATHVPDPQVCPHECPHGDWASTSIIQIQSLIFRVLEQHHFVIDKIVCSEYNYQDFVNMIRVSSYHGHSKP